MTWQSRSNDVYWTIFGKLVRRLPLLYVLSQLMWLCYIVLMYIHRSFFAQAIIEYPVNPLKSPYAPSFLAAYRASSTILKSVREQFNIWPNSCSRFWTMWTFAFSAAVSFELCILLQRFCTSAAQGPFLVFQTLVFLSCIQLSLMFSTGGFWNGCYAWTTIAVSSICHVRIRASVYFIQEGLCL